MKKLVTLALVLTIAIALCACGKTSVPHLLENARLPIALCACGKTTVIEKEIEVPVVPDKYKDLIAAIEAEDFETAQKLLDVMKPVPESPPIVEVKITAENFFDYFEYVEFPEDNTTIDRDSAGNVAGIWAKSGFYLKEIYTIAAEKNDECKVEIGVKYNCLMSRYAQNEITIDLENRSYTINKKLGYAESIDLLSNGECYLLTDAGPYSYRIPIGRTTQLANDTVNGGIICIIDIDSFELAFASGLLYLYG